MSADDFLEQCWEWTGYKVRNGYGQKWYKGRKLLVHRHVYEWINGPIPSDLLVMHSCDNRACFNPRHLRLGTSHDNNLDMARKGRHWNAKKTHCSKGHSLDNSRLEIDKYGHRRRRCRQCGK